MPQADDSKATISLIPIEGIPLIGPGDDIAAAILRALSQASLEAQPGDVLVIAQKVVSKSECRTLSLSAIEPSVQARTIAERTCKDPRYVEAVLRQSKSVLRAEKDVLIVESSLGHIAANAGIDRSNVEGAALESDIVLLLPEDPDRSAAEIRARLVAATGVQLGVIISDSFGRPWRLGTTGVAIGVAGPPAVLDLRGELDLFGRVLQATIIGFADSIAAAAALAMGEGDEGHPVVLVRGLKWQESDQSARDILRPAEMDLFR